MQRSADRPSQPTSTAMATHIRKFPSHRLKPPLISRQLIILSMDPKCSQDFGDGAKRDLFPAPSAMRDRPILPLEEFDLAGRSKTLHEHGFMTNCCDEQRDRGCSPVLLDVFPRRCCKNFPISTFSPGKYARSLALPDRSPGLKRMF